MQCNMKELLPSRSIYQQHVYSQKEGRGVRPMNYLRPLNVFLHYQHFKMEGLYAVKEVTYVQRNPNFISNRK